MSTMCEKNKRRYWRLKYGYVEVVDCCDRHNDCESANRDAAFRYWEVVCLFVI